MGITISQEEKISKEFLKEVQRRFEFVDDPQIVDYVNKIGQKIVAVVPPQPFTYHFYVIKQEVYNAFAGPAGHIFINSGLLTAMDTEEELAGIIAHEVSHVTCRHISEKIDRSKKIGLLTLAGIATGILLGAGGSATGAGAATIGSTAAGQSLSLAYNREDEIQADQIGLQYLTDADYSGQGLMSVLTKIRKKQWYGSDVVPTYLTTHPASEQRMAYIDTWLETHKKKSRRKPSAEDDAFPWVRARLMALYGEESTALGEFTARLQKDPNDYVAHYGYGLALEKSGKRTEAAEHLKKALEKRAFDPHLLNALGKIYFLDGRYEEALATLQGSVGIAPDDPEGLFYLGRTRMEMGQLTDAISVFEKLVEKKRFDKQAFYFLGEAYGKKGIMDNAHYYLGFYYNGKQEWKTAEFHFKRALAEMGDPAKREKIETALKAIKKEKNWLEQQESKEDQQRGRRGPAGVRRH